MFLSKVDVTKGINQELNEEFILQFFAVAVVGVVEWWFRNGLSVPPRVMARQTGILLDRNF
ncbi:TetR/AcrR family transcriptional regulator C-terminal domain-containing protein [Paenibacillus agilis]|uniref:TetR/AcrR family transcriptional regulator C-terminal domain-containing protein n=1 Tax=Paenibacillus agilis TaxID=3020863 RepID=UPI0021BD568F|nr:TetR/AcrR family transcriptional regulator C-terminal domain-containing protein [Paenibacillus agilis]